MRLGVNSFSKHYIYGMQQFSFIRLLLEFAKYANLIKKKKRKKRIYIKIGTPTPNKRLQHTSKYG